MSSLSQILPWLPIFKTTSFSTTRSIEIHFGCQFFGVDSTGLDNRIGVAEGACNRGYFPGTTQTAPSIVHEVRELEEA
jgi:hypothetical protein